MNSKKKRKKKRNKGGPHKNKNKKQKHITSSDKVQYTHTNNYTNNYDPSIHYQHTNASFQTTFHMPAAKYTTTRPHPLNTQNKTKEHLKIIIILQIITIPTFKINIQIDHFSQNSTSSILYQHTNTFTSE